MSLGGVGGKTKNRSVQKYLKFIGKIFTSMGDYDPRHNQLVMLDFLGDTSSNYIPKRTLILKESDYSQVMSSKLRHYL